MLIGMFDFKTVTYKITCETRLFILQITTLRHDMIIAVSILRFDVHCYEIHFIRV